MFDKLQIKRRNKGSGDRWSEGQKERKEGPGERKEINLNRKGSA